MASVTSLDKNMRKLRLEKFTPAAAAEAREWIEATLGEKLPSTDLLEGLKGGVALCKLMNLAVPSPGLKFKTSAMPFVQMENISLFLRACQAPPINMHQHDTFLTVDLYEQKDPAQVLQCLGAFSRAAHAVNPDKIPTTLGPKARAGGVSPEVTGPASPSLQRHRGVSVASSNSSAYGAVRPASSQRTGESIALVKRSPAKGHLKTASTGGPSSPVSSWSKKEHKGATSPAWNIAQYGYMGGASQGNLGISFGGRRQITSAAPQVPSLADKERRRKEEEKRQRLEAQEEEARHLRELQAEEEQARKEEERRWEEETERLREEERRKAEEESREWEEQEHQWKLTEQKRRQEERAAQARLDEERRRARTQGGTILRGQYLSQHKAEQAAAHVDDDHSKRIKELERELELARQREAAYERERQEQLSRRANASVAGEAPAPTAAAEEVARGKSGAPLQSSAQFPAKDKLAREPVRFGSWSRDEREYLHTQREQRQDEEPPRAQAEPVQQLDGESSEPAAAVNTISSPRPLPDPSLSAPVQTRSPNNGSRPLPDPAKYAAPSTPQSRSARIFAPGRQSPYQQQQQQASSPQPTYARELVTTEERDAEERHRVQSQAKTKASGWASKSLLEREMELERQRQREWEEAQEQTAKATPSGDGVDGIGGGIGGRWDVGQWSGYTGGDGQNRGSQGIGAGRRQIVGPRPLPGGPGR